MSDQEKRLVHAVLKGNTEKFRILVERYEKPIYNLMLRSTRCPEEAADLTQETFIKAYEKLGSFNNSKRFFSWLYAIGINHLRDSKRRKTRSPIVEVPEQLLEQASSTRGGIGKKVDAIDLEGAVCRLSLESREALLLRFREEMSMQEIGDILGITQSGAKMRIRRGLARLRQILEGKDHETE
jgi:RNA polymerase sigma-70 factor (ECF subfamily)